MSPPNLSAVVPPPNPSAAVPPLELPHSAAHRGSENPRFQVQPPPPPQPLARLMATTSKELLDCPGEKPSLIESIFPKKKDSLLESKRPGVGKLLTTAVPISQFLGKAKDFLGMMAEANEKLQQDAQGNSRSKYDIEVLDGSDEEHIEMDLLLGVTDLHTTEAVAAAESTMSGFRASKSFGGGGSSSSDTESESDGDHNDNDGDRDDENLLSEEAKIQKSNSGEISMKNRPKKRPKIVVLD